MVRRLLLFNLLGIEILDEILKSGMNGVLNVSETTNDRIMGLSKIGRMVYLREKKLEVVEKSPTNILPNGSKDEIFLKMRNGSSVNSFHSYSCFVVRGVPYLPTYSYSRSPVPLKRRAEREQLPKRRTAAERTRTTKTVIIQGRSKVLNQEMN